MRSGFGFVGSAGGRSVGTVGWFGSVGASGSFTRACFCFCFALRGPRASRFRAWWVSISVLAGGCMCVFACCDVFHAVIGWCEVGGRLLIDLVRSTLVRLGLGMSGGTERVEGEFGVDYSLPIYLCMYK